jgi:tellurite resistance protein TerC
MSTTILWAVFSVVVLGLLALDLGVFHRRAHEVTTREATVWVGIWVGLALLFCAGIGIVRGRADAIEFLTAYLIEESLSVDNIFVFLVIFSYFRVPLAFQHRILFWGILSAIVMRGAMIIAGTTLLGLFHWLTYLFGAFLVLTAVKIVRSSETGYHPESNPVLKLARRFFPVTDGYEGQAFFVRRYGGLFATPLFLVLVTVEWADLVFAVDSIPAVLGVTQDVFIVYTSNVFAILGLRAIFFALAGAVSRLAYLHYGLGAVLAFVGTKMLLSDVFHIPSLVSLAVVVSLLAITVLTSLLARRRTAGAPAEIAREERMTLPEEVASPVGVPLEERKTAADERREPER